jgi:hypothetical protein
LPGAIEALKMTLNHNRVADITCLRSLQISSVDEIFYIPLTPDSPLPFNSIAYLLRLFYPTGGSRDMAEERSQTATWWNRYSLEIGQAGSGRIGPLSLALERREQEWRLYHQEETDADQALVDEAFTLSSGLEQRFTTSERFVFRKTTSFLELVPALADRPVVTRPLVPLTLPGGEETTIYVSSPLWVQINLNAAGNMVREIPIQRASDTWFGPSTREGELCYASQTRSFLSLDEVPQQSHRAITPIRIQNNADTPLLLERVSLPVPYLSLFVTDDGWLWTESVTLVRESDGDMASLQINKGELMPKPHLRPIASPREEMNKGVLVRAFSGLFGGS